MLVLFGTSSYAVFVYLCICIFVFARLTHVNIIFDTSEQSSFQKYTTCVFVFVYVCMRHLVISVLISLDQELSENIWFVWPKTSYSGDATMRNGRIDISYMWATKFKTNLNKTDIQKDRQKARVCI